MSSHYANATVWVGNLDNEDEAATIADLIEGALGDYQATVTVTAHPYPENAEGEPT